MAFTNINEIDDMFIIPDEETGEQMLLLCILDPYEWRDNTKEGKKFNNAHLSVFSKKLNTYLLYIQNKEYEKDFPNERIDLFCIDFLFVHKPAEEFEKKLELYWRQLDAFKDKINLEYAIRSFRPGEDEKVGRALEFCPPGRKIIVEWDEWATVLCEILEKKTNPNATGDESSLEVFAEVKKIFKNSKDSGIEKGVHVKISDTDRPSAIYTEDGKLLWKEEN